MLLLFFPMNTNYRVSVISYSAIFPDIQTKRISRIKSTRTIDHVIVRPASSTVYAIRDKWIKSGLLSFLPFFFLQKGSDGLAKTDFAFPDFYTFCTGILHVM